ncbi:hypothetical protein [Variovorax sp.]|uniref:hypothetical protein n=1 Tax=Variovorax sp. TaxID=1871043 RepID=UPI002D69D225|nr:hypothetical protein [Variovorax sp.]HYP83391.1 hypothetical protein [Variovorax sp.]
MEARTVGWLLGWVIFGVAAALDIGELARQNGSQMTQVRALAFGLASLLGLAMVLRLAVRDGRTGLAFALAVLSALVAGGSLWWLYGLGASPAWISTALAMAAYFLICLVAGLIGAWVAARRRRANAQHEEKLALEREHHRRLERIRAEAATAAGGGHAGAALAEDEFGLPQRPKWED